MAARRALVGLGGLLLASGTVLVFRAFDASSHSASDTLRPLLLTMAPVWAIAAAAAMILLRAGRR